MKAIICDTCGKSVPDTKETDILPLYMRLGSPPDMEVIKRDICPVCLEKLLGFFESAIAEVTTLKPAENVAESVENVTETIHNVPETIENIPVAVEIETTAEIPETIEFIPEPVVKQAPPPQTVISKMTAIECAHCHKPFVPKHKTAKCCSHYCATHKWLTDQKLKKQNEPKKEKPTKPTKPTKPLKMKTTTQEPKPQTKPMPTKKEKIKESSHINSKQDIIGEILNPEIDKKRKKAIAQSPQIRNEDLVPVPGMPRTWVQFKPGSDASSLENFQDRVGKANLGGVQSSKKSTEPIFDEI